MRGTIDVLCLYLCWWLCVRIRGNPLAPSSHAFLLARCGYRLESIYVIATRSVCWSLLWVLSESCSRLILWWPTRQSCSLSFQIWWSCFCCLLSIHSLAYRLILWYVCTELLRRSFGQIPVEVNIWFSFSRSATNGARLIRKHLLQVHVWRWFTDTASLIIGCVWFVAWCGIAMLYRTISLTWNWSPAAACSRSLRLSCRIVRICLSWWWFSCWC